MTIMTKDNKDDKDGKNDKENKNNKDGKAVYNNINKNKFLSHMIDN